MGVVRKVSATEIAPEAASRARVRGRTDERSAGDGMRTEVAEGVHLQERI